MILDTQYLGALADGDDAARQKAREIEESMRPTRIPTAVIWEVYTGIGNAPLAAQEDELRGLYEQLVANRPTVDLSPAVARRAGELNGTHMRSDEKSSLDGADSVVAAHALRFDEAVVSNDSDFEDVDGLDVETY
jgi:predicted nucleic acid-binding protein